MVSWPGLTAVQAAVQLENREASVKFKVIAALVFASTLAAGYVAAQPAPFNDIGVTMGHWHIASKDMEANKKLFLAMGAKMYMPGGAPQCATAQSNTLQVFRLP